MFRQTVDEGRHGSSIDRCPPLYKRHIVLDMLMKKTVFVVRKGIFAHRFENNVNDVGELRVLQRRRNEIVDGEIEIGNVVWVVSRIVF
jgi:hypothetical protein